MQLDELVKSFNAAAEHHFGDLIEGEEKVMVTVIAVQFMKYAEAGHIKLMLEEWSQILSAVSQGLPTGV